MAERRLRVRPKKTGSPGTRPRRLTICQFCMHKPGMKCAISQAFQCKMGD